MSRTSLVDRVEDFVLRGGKPLSLRAILAAFSQENKSSVRGALSYLVAHGRLDHLSRGVYDAPRDRTVPPAGVTRYPVAGNGIGLAPSGRLNTDPTSYLAVPDAVMRRMTGGVLPHAGFVTYAVGDSGWPHILDGDLIVVDRTHEIVDRRRYAVWLGEHDGDVVKRLQVEGGHAVTLVSDNPSVPPRTLRRTDDDDVWLDEHGQTIRFVVRGRVVYPPDREHVVFATPFSADSSLHGAP